MMEQFPLNLVFLNFEMLILFLVLSMRVITGQFKKINKRTWIMLFSILFVSFLLIFSLPRMYFGPSYRGVQVAKNILIRGEPVTCEYIDYNVLKCQKFNYILGLPVLLSIVFSTFGMSPYIAINTISFFGWLSVLLIFLFSHLLFKDEKIALISSVLLALSPLFLLLSSTVSDYVVADFFVILTFIGLLTYLRTNNIKVLIFSSLSLAFLGQLSEVLVFFSIPYFLILYQKDRFNKRFLSSLLIFTIFTFPMLFQHLFFGIRSSLKMFIPYFNLPMFYHLFFLSFVGVYFLTKEKKKEELLLLLGITFIPFALIFFYSVSFFNYFLLLYPGLVLLTSYGMKKISDKYGKSVLISILFIYIIIFSYTYYGMHSGKFTDNYIKETEIAENINKLVPSDCYVFTLSPGILRSTSDVKATYIGNNINRTYNNMIKKGACIYFFYDIGYRDLEKYSTNSGCMFFKDTLGLNNNSKIKLYKMK